MRPRIYTYINNNEQFKVCTHLFLYSYFGKIHGFGGHPDMEFRSFMPCFHLHQYHRRYIRRPTRSQLEHAATRSQKRGAEARPAFGATQSNTKLLLLVVWNRTALPSDPLPSVPHVHAFTPCFHGALRPSRMRKGFHPLWGMGPQIFKSSSSAP